MMQTIQSRQSELAELCRRFGVRRLEVFGSVATARFDPARSDLDFLVIFEPFTPSEYARRYFGLLASLEDLFSRQVDLVDWEAIRNPYFRQVIEPLRTVLYAA